MTVAGVNINPVAFLVVQANNVKLLPVSHSSAIDKLLDYVPDTIDKVNNLVNKQMQIKKEEKTSNQTSTNKESKGEKANNSSSRTKPRRNRTRSNETYEYEYNEVPEVDDIIEEVQDDYDD